MSFSEGQMLRVDIADAMIRSTDSILAEAKKMQDNLALRLKKVENYFVVEKAAFNAANSADEVYSKMPAIMDEMIGSMRIASNTFHNLSMIYPQIYEANDEKFSEENRYQRIFLPQDRVLASLESDAIFVRTPMLWNRQNRRVRGKDGRTIGADRCKNYEDSVRFAIRLAPNFEEYPFANFKEKIVHFLFVYADISANKSFIVDNDNHITKYVNDAITEFLPGGDYPLLCSTYHSAAISKEIPEGTYITVTKASDGLKSHDEIINFWIEKFKNEAELLNRDRSEI